MSQSYVETKVTRMRKFAFAVPAMIALVVIWKHYHLPDVTADGVTYLQIARNILSGKGLGWQALWAPPLHSIVVAACSFCTGTKDLLAATAIAGPLLFLGLVMAVYLLAREVFDLRTALVASVFAALSPHLIFIAFSPEAEITYAFFLTLSLLFFARSVTRRSGAYAVVTGISFALAWMARSEGFLVMVLVFAGAVLLQGRQFHRSTVFKYCLVSTVFFVLAASPYLFFLQKHYGSVVISPKSSYVMIWMKDRIYQDTAKGETSNEDLWGLTPDGQKYRWQEPKGLGYLVGFLMSHPGKSVSVYLQNLAMEVPGRIPNNSGMDKFPQVYPVYLALASLFAMFMPWGSFAREKRSILLAPFLILLVLPVFTGGWWKYLVPYLPLLLVLSAKGLSGGAALIADKVSSDNAASVSTTLATAMAAVIAVRFVLALHPLTLATAPAPAAAPVDKGDRHALAVEARKAGEWGAKRFGPGKNYMIDGWNKTVYYLDGFWTQFPVAEYIPTVAFAKRNGVDYVVIERVGERSKLPPEYAVGLAHEERYLSDTYPYAVDFYRILR